MLDEKLETSFFACASALRQYDHYPLLCHDGSFSFHVVEVVRKFGCHWSPVPTPQQRSLVRAYATAEDEKQHLLGFCDTARSKLSKALHFPLLFNLALSIDHPPASSSGSGCGFHDAIEKQEDVMVQAWKDDVAERASLSMWMSAEERIRMLALLTSHYLPSMAILSMKQLPALLQVFLAHCADQALVEKKLAHCWSRNAVSPHVVSGVWIGMPRGLTIGLSASQPPPSTTTTVLLRGEGVLQAAYIFYKTHMLTALRLPAHFVDGLLHMALDATTSTDGRIGTRTKIASADWAATQQECLSAVYCMQDKVREVRSAQEPLAVVPQELLRALKAAFAVQTLRDAQMPYAGHKTVPRVWQGCRWQRLNQDEVRRKLLLHHHGRQYDELEVALAAAGGGDAKSKKLEFFEVYEASGGSVLYGLDNRITAQPHKFFFCVQTVADKRSPVPSTLVGMESEDLWGYCRWSAYQLLRQPANFTQVRGQVKLYSFAPVLTQLWLSRNPAHWVYAADITADMLGLETGLVVSEAVGEIAEIRDVMMQRLLPRDSIKDALLVLPYLLSFGPSAPLMQAPGSSLQQLYTEFGDHLPPISAATRSDRRTHSSEFWNLVLSWIQYLPPTVSLPSILKRYCVIGRAPAEPRFIESHKQLPPESIFAPGLLQMQRARIKTSHFSVTPFHDTPQQLVRGTWQLMAAVEQYKTGVVLTPVTKPDTDAGLCLQATDFPVAWTQADSGSVDIHVDSFFGVRALDLLNCDSAADQSDNYWYIRHLFLEDFKSHEIKVDMTQQSLDFMWREHTLLSRTTSSNSDNDDSFKGRKRRATSERTDSAKRVKGLDSAADVPRH